MHGWNSVPARGISMAGIQLRQSGEWGTHGWNSDTVRRVGIIYMHGWNSDTVRRVVAHGLARISIYIYIYICMAGIRACLEFS